MQLIQQIFSEYGREYLQHYAQKMPAMHKKALMAIINCRTEKLGGQVYYCKECNTYHYSYHSCQNRHCVVCQNDDAQDWLFRQNRIRLPVTYYLSTFTLPSELRPFARQQQRLIYGLIFKAASGAMKTLAKDKKYLNGEMGMVGILHTWTRTLMYHPHVHFLIPGISLSNSGKTIHFCKNDFLLPVKPLSIIFRAKFRDLLRKNNNALFQKIPKTVWKKDWVVHIKSVGTGEKALLYLSRYIFRVAISNARIVDFKDGIVTYRYRDSSSGVTRNIRVHAMEFIRRFLQHVLPHNFMKIRYYGFYAGVNKNKLSTIRRLLLVEESTSEKDKPKERPLLRCPHCGGLLYFIKELRKEDSIRAP